ncbi:MAG TPA: response regulator transcription factor [Ferruginibacter sp.]|nr:response regulator transcription factor [Ferruginibacter sp.]
MPLAHKIVAGMEAARILIVEDERKIADTLQVGLTENGYQVQVAYDGGMGLHHFTTGRFNLLILDINLPGISGLEICRKVRQQDSSLPVMMLTSMGALADKVEGYNVGADDYLVKPFEFKELLLKINVLLKRSKQAQQAQANILQVADLVMNADSKEVWRGSTRINLTAKEFQLLEYFLHNQNKVVSRAEIALNVWGIDFDTNTNIIDVYINYLRNKIDKHFSPRLIHTQMGMGYILKIKES